MKYYKSNRTILEIITRIGTRFAFSRFGDGEILMMDGSWEGKEKSQFRNEKLVEELREAYKIDDQDYLIGRNATEQQEEGTTTGILAPDINDHVLKMMCDNIAIKKRFYSAIPFHYLFKFDRQFFNRVFSLIKKNKILFMGGKHLESLAKENKFDYYEIPNVQCYDTIDNWYPGLIEKIKLTQPTLLLLSASMSANVVQKRIWNEEINIGTIDFGSVANALSSWEGSHHGWIIR